MLTIYESRDPRAPPSSSKHSKTRGKNTIGKERSKERGQGDENDRREALADQRPYRPPRKPKGHSHPAHPCFDSSSLRAFLGPDPGRFRLDVRMKIEVYMTSCHCTPNRCYSSCLFCVVRPEKIPPLMQDSLEHLNLRPASFHQRAKYRPSWTPVCQCSRISEFVAFIPVDRVYVEMEPKSGDI